MKTCRLVTVEQADWGGGGSSTHYMSGVWAPPPPPPHSHRTREYVIPHHLNPLSREKDIQGCTALSRVLVTVGNYKKHPLSCFFSGNLPETIRPKIPPFPEKMGTRMRPAYAFEWGPGVWGHYIDYNYDAAVNIAPSEIHLENKKAHAGLRII